MEQKKNNMATASMVVGILSIVLACCCFLGFGLGALAIILARLSKVDYQMEGRATAGMITGIIGIVLGVLSMVLWVSLLNNDVSMGPFSYLPDMQALMRGGLL